MKSSDNVQIIERIDKDGTPLLEIVEGNKKENFSSMPVFKKWLTEAHSVEILEVTNFTLKFTTEFLQEGNDGRVYLILWSDVCTYMRSGKMKIYGYKFMK